jgi:hypothetical protein
VRFAVVVEGDRKNYPADERTLGDVLNVVLGRWTQVKVTLWWRRPGGMYVDMEIPESWKEAAP